jgi:hypothetical protein
MTQIIYLIAGLSIIVGIVSSIMYIAIKLNEKLNKK